MSKSCRACKREDVETVKCTTCGKSVCGDCSVGDDVNGVDCIKCKIGR
jgi:hypothetical protein